MADYEARILQERMKMHTTIFGLAFSPCGNYLAACDNFGRISVFCLASILRPEVTRDFDKPLFTFQAHKGPIYSLITADHFLVSGGSSEISGWKWKDLLINVFEPAWKLQPLCENDTYRFTETNALVFDKEDTTLLAGCGNNNIYMWDLESGMSKGTLQGHTDYIQCLALRNTKKQVISGSEDGTVRIWDYKSRSNKKECYCIKPFDNEDLSRPSLGKWIGCVALNEEQDWLVCGGGPLLSLWHMTSFTRTNVMNTPNTTQSAAIFHKDIILSGGSEPSIYHWLTNGDFKTKVPITPTTIYSLAINHTPNNKVLVAAGNCPNIDVFTNFGYKALSLSFC